LTVVLEAGILTALSEEQRMTLNRLNSQVLCELERALNARQDELIRVAQLTAVPDTYLARRDHHGSITTVKLDQRDAMPQELWQCLVELPNDCFESLGRLQQAFRTLDLAWDSASFARYLRDNHLLTDRALYSKAAAHILVGYARIVAPPFEKFMRNYFGSRFHSAPIKKLSRIFTKMVGDEPRLEDEAVAAQDVNLRCAYFALGDIVRGSVHADGPDEMIETIELLQRLSRRSAGGRFDVWRIKNSHHEDADEMTGGYRDVKVLGRFAAQKLREFPLPISMVVEVQVIDTVYVGIKKFMHKAYAIDRGDYV